MFVERPENLKFEGFMGETKWRFDGWWGVLCESGLSMTDSIQSG